MKVRWQVEDNKIYNIQVTTKAFTEIERSWLKSTSKVMNMKDWTINNHSNDN